jgi:hypothetical protein
MSSTLQYGDMVRALGKAGATFVAHIASGATTTAIPLADLNLGSNNLANDLVLIQAGALGTGSVDTLTTISSNTATVLTVPALAAAPSAGYTLWIYRLATIQAVVTASDNIAQVGGQNVLTYAGTPTIPTAGTVLTAMAEGSVASIAANGNIVSFTPTTNGLARVRFTLSVASVVNFAVNGTSQGSIENGSTIPAGSPQTITFPVQSGQTYALQVATAQTSTVYFMAQVVIG